MNNVGNIAVRSIHEPARPTEQVSVSFMDDEHMSNMIIEVVVKLSSEYPVGDVEAGSTDTLELLPKACCTLDLQ